MAIKRDDLNISGYRVSAEALSELSERARQEGKVFSNFGLVKDAIPYDDGDRFLNAEELEKSFARIKADRLPPQKGAQVSNKLRTSLVRAFGYVKDELQHSPQKIPAHYERVIISVEGMEPGARYLSAYVDPRKNEAGLKTLVKKNVIFFEMKTFGKAPEIFGPVEIDARGLPKESVPVSAFEQKDVDTLRSFEGQEEIRSLLAAGDFYAKDTFLFDVVTEKDREDYRALSSKFRAGLTGSEKQELDAFTGYGSMGNVNPALNDWLRSSSRGKHAGVSLLDGIFERAPELPKGLRLFRGVAATKMKGERGKSVTDPAFLCTTLEPSIATMFADNSSERNGAKPKVFMIEVGEGVKGIVTGNAGESELLLPRGTRLLVVGKKRVDGREIVHVRAGRFE